MSKHVKHVPKHRAAPSRTALVKAPQKAIRNTVVLSSIAVAVTGVSVSSGVLASGGEVGDKVQAAAANDLAGATDRTQITTGAERAPAVSREADRRESADPVKQAALSTDPGEGVTGTQELSPSADPRDIARALMDDFGFGMDQFSCLDSLWVRESNWSVTADNPTSSAYGIPQALPGSKMATAGADWADNPATQIRWGLGYIRDTYGSPCAAWGHSQANNWY